MTILAKKVLGVAVERSVPKLANQTLESWFKKHDPKKSKKIVYLFNDEFTNFYDAEIGIDAVILLEKLGYEVKTVAHDESGRSHISKGFLKEAKEICNNNIAVFKDLIIEKTPPPLESPPANHLFFLKKIFFLHLRYSIFSNSPQIEFLKFSNQFLTIIFFSSKFERYKNYYTIQIFLLIDNLLIEEVNKSYFKGSYLLKG